MQHLAYDRAGLAGCDHIDQPVRHAGLRKDFGDGVSGQGGSVAGFSTLPHPAAKAGPIFQVAIAAGKF